jgi:aldehyde:ferredoxin oxidoreductase
MIADGTSVTHGYCFRYGRVDLSQGTVTIETLSRALLSKWIGGVGLGAYFLSREVPPEAGPFSAENKLFLFSGPLSGSRFPGSGTFCCVTKSPMTGFSGATQANGYLAAYLKSSGLDGLIIQGESPEPVYLLVEDGRIVLRSAAACWGKGTFETERLLQQAHQRGTRKPSVYSIGPAGENRVRFAALVGDQGHVAGHGGSGAVFGAKKLKAIVAVKGDSRLDSAEPQQFEAAVKVLREKTKVYMKGGLKSHGTGCLVRPAYELGELPINNLQTNLLEGVAGIDGEYFRANFDFRPKTCHACPIAHNAWVRITDGPYAGLEAEEPEYENIAALGSNIGVLAADAIIYLSYLTDDLGINVTETGWVLSWLMECSEKGLLGSYQDEGALAWGDVAGAERMIHKIVSRQGELGELLAEGVMRSCRALGGEAEKLGVYTLKGGSPRGHDHRARWTELLDTCVSNTGTIEAIFGRRFPDGLDAPLENFFDPKAVARSNGRINGWRQFEDATGTCRFCTSSGPDEALSAFSAHTGMSLDVAGAAKIGRRIVTLLRLYNCRSGLTRSLDRPSPRYGCAPVNGPAAGHAILDSWDEILDIYYQNMGWDSSGVPTAATLREMDLADEV